MASEKKPQRALKTCRFCHKDYQPKATARKERDWCSSYECEGAKAVEELDRVKAWQTQRRVSKERGGPAAA